MTTSEERLKRLLQGIKNNSLETIGNDPNNVLDYEKEAKRIKNKSDDKDITHRSRLVNWVIIFASCYILIVFVLLFFVHFCKGKGLSDVVTITLLGTTTANVLGLPYIVLKGLFKVKE